ncbi:MAG: leucyl aminopeptidase [Candidatus Poseidoniaceae archaeon]|jgi:leucyl aminopeptidase|nr:leucyl aminopeptidase [Candidatus Poseidoniaceae archaeon]
MKVNVESNENILGTLVLPLWQGSDSISDNASSGIHRDLRNQIDNVLQAGDFKAKSGTAMTLAGTQGGKAILVGLGKQEDANSQSMREAGAKIVSSRSKMHGTTLSVRLHGIEDSLMASLVEGMILRDYSYDHYKSKDEEEEEEGDLEVLVTCEEDKTKALSASAELSCSVAKGVFMARDLGNAPPNDLYPQAYAKQALDFADKHDNLEVTVISYDQAVDMGMGGLVGVGMGSIRKPCMVIFELNGDKPGPSPCIVGKGITFDTGGISIKPSPSMDEMKYDMHGSATSFGTIVALAESGWKERVVAVSCMAENMPSANAQRPGDVIKTYSGKTVEVLNTDAEGRLVLSDGLWYAGTHLNTSYIIDLATLTGACVVALGHEASGLWSNDDELLAKIKAAGEHCGEIAWPMPLFKAFEKEMTDSKIADTRNLGAGRWGGSNTAAAFLKQFVPEKDGKQIPWAHLDIAGTAWGAKTNKLVKNGATGIHVRTLHHLITGQ